MSSVIALLPAAGPDGHGDSELLGGWLGWLRERIDPRWRASEWDQGRLLFTGDPASPATVVAVCPLPGCGVTINDPHWSGYCKTCHDEFTASGLGKEAFEVAYTRGNRRLNVYRRDKECEVLACHRDAYGFGLCVTHYRGWVKARDRPGADRAAWIAARGACHGPGAVLRARVRQGKGIGDRPALPGPRPQVAASSARRRGRRVPDGVDRAPAALPVGAHVLPRPAPGSGPGRDALRAPATRRPRASHPPPVRAARCRRAGGRAVHRAGRRCPGRRRDHEGRGRPRARADRAVGGQHRVRPVPRR